MNNVLALQKLSTDKGGAADGSQVCANAETAGGYDDYGGHGHGGHGHGGSHISLLLCR